MTAPVPDPLDRLLAGSRVPALSADFADRLVIEAQRHDRVPTLAGQAAPRHGKGRFGRRGVWATVLTVNLMLASAVAAAFGTGAISGPKLVAAAQHVVERITHPAPHHPHHAIAHTHRLAGPSHKTTPAPAAGAAMAFSSSAAPPAPPWLRGRHLLRWEARHADPVTSRSARQELRAERQLQHAGAPSRHARKHLRRLRRQEASRAEAAAIDGIPPAAAPAFPPEARPTDTPGSLRDRREQRRERRWRRWQRRFGWFGAEGRSTDRDGRP